MYIFSEFFDSWRMNKWYIHNETKCYSFSQVTQIKNENCITSSMYLMGTVINKRVLSQLELNYGYH